MKNPRLYYLLGQIGLTPQKIAEDPRVMSSRAHVTECLLNKPGRGKNTRKRIAPLLTPEILSLLGWNSRGNWPVKLFHVESHS